MLTQSGPLFVLTASHVDAKLSRAKEIDAELERLQTEKDEITRWVSAVEILTGRKLIGAELGSDDDELSFPQFVKQSLKVAGGMLTLNQLKEAVLESPLRDRYERNSNSLYNTVSRLTHKGELRREGDLIFLPEHYEELEQSGALENTISGSAASKESIVDIIEDFLRGPEEAEIADIRARIEEIPAFKERLERNPQYIYTVLSRMAKRGRLVRSDSGYRLANKKEAARTNGPASLNADEDDASDSVSPSIESQGGFTNLLG